MGRTGRLGRSGARRMTVRTASRRRLSQVVLAAFAAVWLALVAVPPVAFLAWRGARLERLSAAPAQAEWDRFRADMREQAAGGGPVRRKVPRSPEPPERVWLRDYPHVVVAAWVLFVGLLGAVIGALLRGALGPRGVSGPGSAGP